MYNVLIDILLSSMSYALVFLGHHLPQEVPPDQESPAFERWATILYAYM